MVNQHKASAMGFSCIIPQDLAQIKVKIETAIYKKSKFECSYCIEMNGSNDNKKKNCYFCGRSSNSDWQPECYFRIPLKFEESFNFDVIKENNQEPEYLE